MNLTKSQLKHYVDERYIERGQDYFNQGLVVLDKVTENHVTAHCAGSHVYKVTLAINGRKLKGDCTCLAFADFGPCKHIAATALTVIADRDSQYSSSPDTIERVNQHHTIQKRLLGLSKSELVDLLMQFTNDEEIAWLLDEE
ncbi:MAG: hypothetical protein GXP03_07300 [Alphaproteobacteria bacterium]|nr:hypothetical protein [Alphaproteobacteria bacterium]